MKKSAYLFFNIFSIFFSSNLNAMLTKDVTSGMPREKKEILMEPDSTLTKWKNFEDCKKKFNLVHKKKDDRCEAAKKLIFAGIAVKTSNPSKISTVDTTLKNMYDNLNKKGDRQSIKDTTYGCADELSDTEKEISDYEIVRKRALQKIRNEGRHTTLLQETTSVKNDISNLEQKIIETKKNLENLQEQRRTKSEKELYLLNELTLIEQANTYLEKAQENKINKINIQIKDLKARLSELDQQHNDLNTKLNAERTVLDQRMQLQEKILNLLNTSNQLKQQLTELEATKQKMEDRKNNHTYTWSDYFKLR
ncbi:MAG: hypothetical protein WDZ41_01650 [Candidatus Babeliales bacterium]